MVHLLVAIRGETPYAPVEFFTSVQFAMRLVTSERAWHLGLRRPLGSVFSWLARKTTSLSADPLTLCRRLFFALVMLAAAGAVPTLLSPEGINSVFLRGMSLAGLLFFTGTSIAWYRLGRLPRYALPLEALALLAFQLGFKEPMAGLGVVYSGLYFRAVLASTRQGMGYGAALFGTLVLAEAFSPSGVNVPASSLSIWMQAPSIVVSATALAAFGGSLIRELTARNAKEALQQRLAFEASHDALTGLPNRASFRSSLELALSGPRLDEDQIAVCILDLNGFKSCNDTYGHPFGDQLLQRVADRLAASVRHSDVVARLGGDEFALVLPGIRTHQLDPILSKICTELERLHVVDGRTVHIGASLGVALSPMHGTDPDALISRSDEAMYVAKRAGDSYALWVPGLGTESAGELREAIQGGLLRLHYQPKLNLRNQRVEGLEGLVRWIREDSLREPDTFVPQAEQSGLIHDLTSWVLREAVQQLHAWYEQGMDLGIAVNVSAADLNDPLLIEKLSRLLSDNNVPARALTLEITESAMVEGRHVASALEHIGALGVRLAIDDFGKGYSSLTYLSRLPVHQVKIDASLVQTCATRARDRAIVKATTDLAHDLGLEVIAEGVEDAPSLETLADLGCDAAQGYYIARPMSCEKVSGWLRRTARRPFKIRTKLAASA